MLPDKLLLDVPTPLGFRVTCTAAHWMIIWVVKRAPMRDRLWEVALTLHRPDEIRRSRRSQAVVLFHRHDGRRWLCAVVRYNPAAGQLITAYPADRVKPGDLLWKS